MKNHPSKTNQSKVMSFTGFLKIIVSTLWAQKSKFSKITKSSESLYQLPILTLVTTQNISQNLQHSESQYPVLSKWSKSTVMPKMDVQPYK